MNKGTEGAKGIALGHDTFCGNFVGSSLITFNCWVTTHFQNHALDFPTCWVTTHFLSAKNSYKTNVRLRSFSITRFFL